jgi:hypothetical protein
MKILLSIIFIIIFIYQVVPSNANVLWRGYLENRLYIVQTRPDIYIENFFERIAMGELNRGRLEMDADVTDNVHSKIALDLFTYHGILAQGYTLLGRTVKITQYSNIDRAFVNIYFPRFDITAGKQYIGWGVSNVWKPLDIFNKQNLLEISAEKPGVNAMNLRHHFGKFASASFVIVPQDSFQTSQGGFRFESNLLRTDLSGNIMWDGLMKEYTLGFDMGGDTEIGWWIEGRYTFSDLKDDYWQAVIGADYSISILNRTLVLMIEYFHDETGQKSKDDYNIMDLFSGNRITLAQDYIYSSATYLINDFTRFSLINIANFNDNSGMMIPSISHSLFPNTDLTIGGNFYYGIYGTEYKPNLVNGKFQMYNPNFYTWLKVSF